MNQKEVPDIEFVTLVDYDPADGGCIIVGNGTHIEETEAAHITKALAFYTTNAPIDMSEVHELTVYKPIKMMLETNADMDDTNVYKVFIVFQDTNKILTIDLGEDQQINAVFIYETTCELRIFRSHFRDSERHPC